MKNLLEKDNFIGQLLKSKECGLIMVTELSGVQFGLKSYA